MQFLKYSVIRLVLFFAVFFLLMWFGWGDTLLGVFLIVAVALIVAFAVSYLFLNKLRLSANAQVQQLFSDKARKKSKHELDDEAAEDGFQQ